MAPSYSAQIDIAVIDDSQIGVIIDEYIEIVSLGVAEDFEYTFPFIFRGNAIIELIIIKNIFLSEIVSLTDSIIKNIFKILIDNATLTDIWSKAIKKIQIFTDTLNLSDSIIKNTLKIITDQIILSDIWSEAIKKVQILTDSVTLSDSTIKDTLKIIIDQTTLSDIWSEAIKKVQILSDAITLTDSTIMGIGFNIIDSLSLGFAGQFEYTFPFFFYKNEIMLKELSIYREMTLEGIILSDNIWYTTYERLIETLNLTDTLTSTRTAFQNIYETMILSDSVLKQPRRILSDYLTIGIAGLFEYEFPFRFQGDAVLERVWHIFRFPEETITLSDIIQIGKEFFRFFTENQTLIDSIIKNTSYNIIQSLVLIDIILASRRRIETLVELLNLNDKFFHNMVYIPSIGADLDVFYWLNTESANNKKLIGSLKNVAFSVDLGVESYHGAQKRTADFIARSKTLKASLESFKTNNIFQTEIINEIKNTGISGKTYTIMARTKNLGATKTIKFTGARIVSINEDINNEGVIFNVELEAEGIDDK